MTPSIYRIKTLLQLEQSPENPVTIQGWVRTRRDSPQFSFLEINDGSSLKGIQVIVDSNTPGADFLPKAGTGASVCIEGNVVESPGKGQKWEIQATKLELIGETAEEYPLQKKRHSVEFLREIPHLRPRTNLFGAVFRTRAALSQAVHEFFTQKDFLWLHTPILTTSDCEGAGEMFRVTTLEPNSNKPASEDFFGQTTHLTVSGQLEAEAFACSLGGVYTFGPTFRAENSNTSRHAAEFWMIEPEAAFLDLEGNMDLAEEFTRHCCKTMLEKCEEDLNFFDQFISKGLRKRLEQISNNNFVRISYTEAVERLLRSKVAFEYPISWGVALQSEHERWLVEQEFGKPVIVHDYPQAVKPFYMRLNDEADTIARAGNPPHPTVTAMDVLAPGVGELIGGAQREERLEYLTKAMKAAQLNLEEYQWYLDLRRFGSVPHAGFGLGFERLLMLVTGVNNIRDVLPSPRTPGNCKV